MPVLTFLLGNWRLLIMGILLLIVGIQTWRLDRAEKREEAVRAEFAEFKGGVAALGAKAQKEALERERRDVERKEKADADHAKTKSDLNAVYAAYRSLRDQRSGGGGLSSPAPSASSPERICFDPTQFRAALRRLDEGILGIAQTGDQAIADLDTAKKWARGE